MANPTVAVRIVVHLMKFRHSPDEHVFPRETTQLGTAEALGIGRTHAGNELRKLERDGHVEAKTAHVTTEDRKMIVYTLTAAGRSMGRRFIEVYRYESPSASRKLDRTQDTSTDREIARRLSEETRLPLREPPEPSPLHR